MSTAQAIERPAFGTYCEALQVGARANVTTKPKPCRGSVEVVVDDDESKSDKCGTTTILSEGLKAAGITELTVTSRLIAERSIAHNLVEVTTNLGSENNIMALVLPHHQGQVERYRALASVELLPRMYESIDSCTVDGKRATILILDRVRLGAPLKDVFASDAHIERAGSLLGFWYQNKHRKEIDNPRSLKGLFCASVNDNTLFINPSLFSPNVRPTVVDVEDIQSKLYTWLKRNKFGNSEVVESRLEPTIKGIKVDESKEEKKEAFAIPGHVTLPGGNVTKTFGLHPRPDSVAFHTLNPTSPEIMHCMLERYTGENLGNNSHSARYFFRYTVPKDREFQLSSIDHLDAYKDNILRQETAKFTQNTTENLDKADEATVGSLANEVARSFRRDHLNYPQILPLAYTKDAGEGGHAIAIVLHTQTKMSIVNSGETWMNPAVVVKTFKIKGPLVAYRIVARALAVRRDKQPKTIEALGKIFTDSIRDSTQIPTFEAGSPWIGTSGQTPQTYTWSVNKSGYFRADTQMTGTCTFNSLNWAFFIASKTPVEGHELMLSVRHNALVLLEHTLAVKTDLDIESVNVCRLLIRLKFSSQKDHPNVYRVALGKWEDPVELGNDLILKRRGVYRGNPKLSTVNPLDKYRARVETTLDKSPNDLRGAMANLRTYLIQTVRTLTRYGFEAIQIGSGSKGSSAYMAGFVPSAVYLAYRRLAIGTVSDVCRHFSPGSRADALRDLAPTTEEAIEWAKVNWYFFVIVLQSRSIIEDSPIISFTGPMTPDLVRQQLLDLTMSMIAKHPECPAEMPAKSCSPMPRQHGVVGWAGADNVGFDTVQAYAGYANEFLGVKYNGQNYGFVQEKASPTFPTMLFRQETFTQNTGRYKYYNQETQKTQYKDWAWYKFILNNHVGAAMLYCSLLGYHRGSMYRDTRPLSDITGKPYWPEVATDHLDGAMVLLKNSESDDYHYIFNGSRQYGFILWSDLPDTKRDDANPDLQKALADESAGTNAVLEAMVGLRQGLPGAEIDDNILTSLLLHPPRVLTCQPSGILESKGIFYLDALHNRDIPELFYTTARRIIQNIDSVDRNTLAFALYGFACLPDHITQEDRLVMSRCTRIDKLGDIARAWASVEHVDRLIKWLQGVDPHWVADWGLMRLGDATTVKHPVNKMVRPPDQSPNVILTFLAAAALASHPLELDEITATSFSRADSAESKVASSNTFLFYMSNEKDNVENTPAWTQTILPFAAHGIQFNKTRHSGAQMVISKLHSTATLQVMLPMTPAEIQQAKYNKKNPPKSFGGGLLGGGLWGDDLDFDLSGLDDEGKADTEPRKPEPVLTVEWVVNRLNDSGVEYIIGNREYARPGEWKVAIYLASSGTFLTIGPGPTDLHYYDSTGKLQHKLKVGNATGVPRVLRDWTMRMRHSAACFQISNKLEYLIITNGILRTTSTVFDKAEYPRSVFVGDISRTVYHVKLNPGLQTLAFNDRAASRVIPQLLMASANSRLVTPLIARVKWSRGTPMSRGDSWGHPMNAILTKKGLRHGERNGMNATWLGQPSVTQSIMMDKTAGWTNQIRALCTMDNIGRCTEIKEPNFKVTWDDIVQHADKTYNDQHLMSCKVLPVDPALVWKCTLFNVQPKLTPDARANPNVLYRKIKFFAAVPDHEPTHPLVRLFQAATGVLLSAKQRRLFFEMANGNRMAWQAIMGIGKSSVLMPLLLRQRYRCGKSGAPTIVQPTHLVMAAEALVESKVALLVPPLWKRPGVMSDSYMKERLVNEIVSELSKTPVAPTTTGRVNLGCVVFDEIDSMYDPLKSNYNVPQDSDPKPHPLVSDFAEMPRFYRILWRRRFSAIASDDLRQKLENDQRKVKLDKLNDDYGKSSKTPMAIPYSAPFTPVIGSRYSDPDAAALYTIAMKKQVGLTLADTKELLNHLQQLTQGIPTLAQDIINMTLGTEKRGAAKLTAAELQQGQYSVVWERIKEDRDVVQYYTTQVLLPTHIRFYRNQANVSFIDFMHKSTVPNSVGFSGTVWMEPLPFGRDSYAPVLVDCAAENDIYRAIVGRKDQPNNLNEIYQAKSINTIMDLVNSDADYNVLIDVAGALKDSKLSELKTFIPGIVGLTSRGWTKNQDLEKSSGSNKTVYYYDKKNIVGVDRVLPVDAVGVVIVDPRRNTLTEVAQAVYRLREIQTEQSVVFVLYEPYPGIKTRGMLYQLLHRRNRLYMINQRRSFWLQCINTNHRVKTDHAAKSYTQATPYELIQQVLPEDAPKAWVANYNAANASPNINGVERVQEKARQKEKDKEKADSKEVAVTCVDKTSLPQDLVHSYASLNITWDVNFNNVPVFYSQSFLMRWKNGKPVPRARARAIAWYPDAGKFIVCGMIDAVTMQGAHLYDALGNPWNPTDSVYPTQPNTAWLMFARILAGYHPSLLEQLKMLNGIGYGPQRKAAQGVIKCLVDSGWVKVSSRPLDSLWSQGDTGSAVHWARTQVNRYPVAQVDSAAFLRWLIGKDVDESVVQQLGPISTTLMNSVWAEIRTLAPDKNNV